MKPEKKTRRREKPHNFTDPRDIELFNQRVAEYKKLNYNKAIGRGNGLYGIAKQLNITYMQAVFAYCSALVKIEKYLRKKGYDENYGFIIGK